MAQAKRTARWKGSRALIALCGLILLAFGGCLAGVDGGPHPEPPDGLGPPASGLDGGFATDNPDGEGQAGGGAGGVSGAAPGGAGGAGGASGSGGSDGGVNTPPACTDADIDGGCDDEDAGALR
jgi:hypothetical protein